jgi:ABC-type glycerol-3-phosphate transport system substrate-binding protein
MRLLKKTRARLLKTCLITLALGTAGTSWAMNHSNYIGGYDKKTNKSIIAKNKKQYSGIQVDTH